MNRNHPPDKERFHDKKDPCPYCDWDGTGHNKHLYTSLLNNHLYGQVERQQKDVKFVKDAQKEAHDMKRKYGE